MNEAIIVLNNNIQVLKRLTIVAAPVLVLVLVLNKASLFVIIAVAAITAALIFFKNKTWLLLALAAPTLAIGTVVYIPVTTGWIYEARVAELLLALAAVVYGLHIFLNNKISELKADKITLLLGAYLLFSIASIAYIADFRLYVFGLKIAAYSFLAYFLALNLIDSARKRKWFLGGIALTAVILSIQLFVKFYETGWSTKFFFERNTILIPIGPVATTAAILAFLAPILLGYYFSEPRLSKARPFVFFAFGISVLAVFLTLGKAAILSLGAGLFLIFRRTKNKVPLILFAAWFILAAYYMFNPYFSGLLERLQTALIDANTQFRITEYKLSWQVIKAHPFLGVGAGQQLWYFKQALNQEVGQQVNNYFLQAMLDLGLVGLTIAVLLFAQLAGKARAILRQRGNDFLVIGFAAALVVAFLNGLAEVTIFALPYAIIFWLILGAIRNIPANQQI